MRLPLWKIRHGIMSAALATAVHAMPGMASAADTIQDFSANFNTGSTPARLSLHTFGTAPGPSLQPADPLGWDGGFLRMTTAVNSQANTVAFNQVYSGDYEALNVSFEFSIGGGPTGADGLAFAYLNSEFYGADTTTVAPSISEEPNFAGSFGVGFDTYNNAGDAGPIADDTNTSSISLHYNGVELGDIDLTSLPLNTLETSLGLPIYTTNIAVVPTAGGSNVTVSVTDGVNSITPFDNFFVAGLAPYDGRAALGGRTGGLNADQDIDNFSLRITPVGGSSQEVLREEFENPVDPPVINPPTPLGGTAFTRSRLGSEPDPTITHVPGGAENDGFMRLATQTAGQNNIVAFDKTADTLGESIKVDFDFRIFDQSGSSGIADGMSVMIVDTGIYGDTGPLNGFTGVVEEPNLLGGLGIAFDTYDNDSADPTVTEEGVVNPAPDRRANHVSLHWNNQLIELQVLDQSEFDLVSDLFDHATLQVDFVEGGANISLSLLDATDGLLTTVFNDFFVEGVSFGSSARLAFGGRTGGLADHHDIDNVLAVWDYVDDPGVVGDTDNDGDVDLDDLNNVRNNFGGAGIGDTDGDNDVDLDDLNNVRNNFGASATVPEPGTFALGALLLAGFGLFRRGRAR